jgi:hypothetical protein
VKGLAARPVFRRTRGVEDRPGKDPAAAAISMRHSKSIENKRKTNIQSSKLKTALDSRPDPD